MLVVDTSERRSCDALGTGGGDGHQADQLTVLASRDVYLTDRGFDMDGMLDFYGAGLWGTPRPVRLRLHPHGRGDDLGVA